MHSFWRKLLFSARFRTLRISLSNDITRESRILYHRNIQDRVKKIAPFLTFDRDSYLVIDEKGRLFWIIDAYTTSDRYPYSEPTPGTGNYIRNSVKAVVDAYKGTVSFFISDPSDPVVRAYAGCLFPVSSNRWTLCRRIFAPIFATLRTSLPFRRTSTPPITCRTRRSFIIRRTS